MERERLKSRLGFIMLSAGCAIGIGNIWKFPYMVGENGGGIFVMFYLIFLLILGIPVLIMEYSIGRASRASIMTAYNILKPEKKAWRLHGKFSFIGNYILMMFYSTVSGWMAYYFFHYTKGDLKGMKMEAISNYFADFMDNPSELIVWMIIMVGLGFLICSIGLQKGVEKITKWMMSVLFIIIIVLAIHSVNLPGGKEGLKFYLQPDMSVIKEKGLFNVIVNAMNQSFFTLSIGIGSMMIFGSYMDKKKKLLSESLTVASLDTFVAITAGIIIFPACFSYGIKPDSGPSLVFITLPNVFNNMSLGRLWGSLFFLFMTFASLSTLIAVFENIMGCCIDTFKWNRKKSSLINFFIIIIGSLPCVLGFNVLKGFQPFGEGSAVLDFEDFIVSNLLLPFGSVIMILFCTRKKAWGYKNFLKEVNEGRGVSLPANNLIKVYIKYILPLIITGLMIYGVVSKFQ